jgi:SAM-dependent methyltransferase
VKNKERWKPSHYGFEKNGKLKGTHMHKIIGHAYARIIKEHASGLLADIGCGDVPYYSIYKDLVVDNVCVDWGQEKTGTTYLDHIADLNEGIPLDGNQFDTVLCTDVLEHIKHPDLLFSEMTRIMKDDAKMIITVPFLYWIHNPPHDYHRYTKHMLIDFCRKNNLRVVSVEEYGGLPEVLYDLVFKGYVFYNFPFRRAFLYVWKKIGIFMYRRNFVKRLSNSSRETFPLGYILVAQK